MLQLGATATVVGAAGCQQSSGDGDAPTEGYLIEPDGGEQFCVTAFETEENVSDFYGYNTGDNDSRGGETGFEKAETASLLLHRDTAEGRLSLVFLHGSADESDLRRADYTLSGFEGMSWLVKDDPGSYPYDSYASTEGTPTGVNWRWQGGTDGGAIGPLGEEFDLSVSATTQEVETWRVIGGDGSVAGTLPVGGSVRIVGTPEEGCRPEN